MWALGMHGNFKGILEVLGVFDIFWQQRSTWGFFCSLFSPLFFFTPKKVIEMNRHVVASLLYLKEEKIVWTLMLVRKAMSSLQFLNRCVIGGWGWLLSVSILWVTTAESWQHLLDHGCFLIIHFQCLAFNLISLCVCVVDWVIRGITVPLVTEFSLQIYIYIYSYILYIRICLSTAQ